ncbi:MAG: hypothetical protein Q4C03_04250 [bacterium]|nr:hypothetical protein [bacterium]
MELLYEKEVDKMTPKELRKDRNLQQWLLRNVRRMKNIAEWYTMKAEETTETQPRTAGEEYIIGALDDREYKRKSRKEKMDYGKNKWVEQMWRERIEWCDYAEKYLLGSVAAIDDAIINYEKPEPEKPPKPKKLRNYGYDPRRYASKSNPLPKQLKKEK